MLPAKKSLQIVMGEDVGKRTLGLSPAIEFVLYSTFLYTLPKNHDCVYPLGVEGLLNSLPMVFLTFSYKVDINLQISVPNTITLSS